MLRNNAPSGESLALKNLKDINEELRKRVVELERNVCVLKLENQQLKISQMNCWDSDIELKSKIRKLEDENFSSYEKMLQMEQHIEELTNSAQTRELEMNRLDDVMAEKNRKMIKMDIRIKQLKDESQNRIESLIMDYDELFHKNQHLEARIKDLEQDQNNEELDRKKDEKSRQLMDMWMSESKKCDQLEFENRMLKGQLGRMDLSIWPDAPCQLGEPRMSSTLKQTSEQEDSGFQH